MIPAAFEYHAPTSIAEIVHSRRAAKPEALEDREGQTASVPLESKDPVCGMLVEIASARHRSEASGRAVYFCCAGCKEAFERDPQRYASALPG